MPLPKISTPTYELELPSTGELIKYRPFLVKEEKVLLIALESEDTKQITNAIKNVIKNCIFTKNIKVETLPTFDIEFLFLNIRGKSVGEEIEVNVICPKVTMFRSIFLRTWDFTIKPSNPLLRKVFVRPSFAKLPRCVPPFSRLAVMPLLWSMASLPPLLFVQTFRLLN